MGGGTFNPKDYAAFASTTRGKRTEEIYTSRSINSTLNPHGVKVRESRDSTDNPNSTPLIVALDVTGSMGMIADVIARKGLGVLFEAILERRPISDPHLMFMGIGDAHAGDSAPLQVSQFEADNRIVEQLTQLYLEHGGGGNDFESYDLAWYFAAFHTEIDSLIKRGKRGYLFTVGDECAPTAATANHLKKIIGDDVEQALSAAEVLALAQRKYDVFHVVIKEGNYAHTQLEQVRRSWNDLLGQRVIYLDDHTKLAEVIVSAIEVAEGRGAEESAHAWGGAASGVVLDAVKHLPASAQPKLLESP